MIARPASLVPGVTVRVVEQPPPEPFRLSIAGFVGQAERGPLNRPQRLTTWGQYQDVFGGFVGYGYLPYTVFTFFANGGEVCWVVRVAAADIRAAARTLRNEADQPVIRLLALDPGAWGNAVTVRCEPRPAGTLFQERGFRLTFRHGAREEIFDDLHLDPTHPRYFARVINGEPPAEPPEQRLERARLGLSQRVWVLPTDALLQGMADPQSRPAALGLVDPVPLPEPLMEGEDGNNREGLTLAHYLGEEPASGEPFAPAALTLPLPGEMEGPRRLGLAALEAVSEVGTVHVPDLVLPDLHQLVPAVERPPEGIVFAPPRRGVTVDGYPGLEAGQRVLIEHCRRLGDRLAVLDAPLALPGGVAGGEVGRWAARLSPLPGSENVALYTPWLEQRAEDFGGRRLWIPPGGAVAGIYARSETRPGAGSGGIGKAPANEVLTGAVNLEQCLDDARQAELNPLGVNALRAFPGRGLRVWGARTLSRNPIWRYVNVRRVIVAIRKRIVRELAWTVFEPNGPALWSAVRAFLTAYLLELFEQGALAGERPEEAFFVRCDATTNPAAVVDAGRMLAEVGVAPARPAEFVVITLLRNADALVARERST